MKIRSYLRNLDKAYNENSKYFVGLDYWLFVRVHLCTKKFYKKNSEVVLTFKESFSVFFSIFNGFLNWFRLSTFDYWFISDSLERRMVKGVAVDKLVDYPASLLDKSLVLERPLFKLQKSVASRHRVSLALLIILEKIIARFFSFDEIKKNTSLKNLLDNENVDVLAAARKMTGQYYVMKILLKLKCPKFVFIVNSYNSYGYIKALHEKGVQVCEFQHGVISEDHYGYNVFGDFDEGYFPDFLLSFGEQEKKVFSAGNKWIDPSRVVPIGSYYIDHINQQLTLNRDLLELKKRYNRTVAVSMQDCKIGEEYVQLIIRVAKQLNHVLFLLNVRSTPVETYLARYSFSDNIIFMEELNVYETIKHADFHSTAYSSCVLEAPGLGVRNIVVDFEQRASSYYGNVFEGSNNTIFTNDEKSFMRAICSEPIIESELVKGAHGNIISANYKRRIKEFIKEHVR